MNTNQAWQDQTRNRSGEFGHRIHPEHDTFTPPAADGADAGVAPLTEAELHARFIIPDADVTRKAVDDALNSVDYMGRATSWETLMGDARRTEKNQERFRELKLAVIEADPGLRDGFRKRVRSYVDLRQRNQTHAAAFEAGVPTVFDKHFDDQWEGRTPGSGFSKADLEEQLVNAKKTRSDLIAGRVRPSAVVGSGHRNPRKGAMEWIDGRVAAAERDLETHGRSNAVNVSNAEYRHRNGI